MDDNYTPRKSPDTFTLVTVRFKNGAPNFYVEVEDEEGAAVESVARRIEDRVAVCGNFQREDQQRIVVIEETAVLAITSEPLEES